MTEMASDAVQASPNTLFEPAKKPTMYFIGVTTGKSSIMKVFPRWAEYLKFGDVQIKGIDCKVHDDPQTYRNVVEFIKRDPQSRGALVTTHKLDLFHAAADLFDDLDPYARMLDEVSGIAKRGEKLVGYAKDPQTSGLAGGDPAARILGNDPGGIAAVGRRWGGHGLDRVFDAATTRHESPDENCRFDRDAARLKEIEALCRRLGDQVPITFHHAAAVRDNDAVVGTLKPFSMVINATGLGKEIARVRRSPARRIFRGRGSPGTSIIAENFCFWIRRESRPMSGSCGSRTDGSISFTDGNA